ncbi:PqqD family protein [Limnoraphis robusta Tam1]|uniref:PqqD family protein n=1 Tax=Limnoraphis robusta CCNP1315 TaxID=3110306 RepID=A0ABU5U002_9CYAN|nr:PqqD family protein [Limnoraphis robusta]MEA5496406.1 PqqD family protein [Limnoraphis robusta BA-68 BA1]MEA5520414.1 PqqD family protein [Limnoraphis robusta CCNP1315]MEA5539491.1 PqqD family protein [Limnoraphis robusta Tam1]MEA5546933.1 PqqD family protein [Limnoraphis robusta CCNP1324]
MIEETSIIYTAKTQRSSRLNHEVIILDLETEEYYGSQWVGATIWILLSQPRTVKEIRELILSRYQVDPHQCDRDLMNFLLQLQANGLIKLSPSPSPLSLLLHRVTRKVEKLLNNILNSDQGWGSQYLKFSAQAGATMMSKLPYQTPVLTYCGSNHPSLYG